MELTATIVPVKNSLIKNPVFVTGLSRSGKLMLASILSSFKRTEHLNVDYLMEQVVMMNSLGLIRDDVSECLLKYALDLKAYNIFMGRDSNIRPGDYTSIWKSGRILKFVKRLLTKSDISIPEEIENENSLFIFLVHNALWHFKLYHRAFPLLKMIEIRRHPIDIATSWFQRGYGLDMKNSFHNGTLTIKAEDKHLLYYAAGKEKKYAAMSQGDRVIHMIRDAQINHHKTFNGLGENEKRKVRTVYFEKLVTEPRPVLKELASFLETEEGNRTGVVCRRERCPRILNSEKRKMKLNELKKDCTNSAYEILVNMAEEYDREAK